jgi:hypothetical protein
MDRKGEEIAGWPGWTPRKLLQKIGTDLFRNKFDEDIWAKLAAERMMSDPDVDVWLVTDARFSNELCVDKFLPRDYLVVSVRILRKAAVKVGSPGKLPRWRRLLGFGPVEHESETALDGMHMDHTIRNDGDIADLEKEIKELMEGLRMRMHLSLNKPSSETFGRRGKLRRN